MLHGAWASVDAMESSSMKEPGNSIELIQWSGALGWGWEDGNDVSVFCSEKLLSNRAFKEMS